MVECFKTSFNEINGRLDCFFYKPEFIALEKIIQKRTCLKLGDFIEYISSGETPNKRESDKYYTNSEDGIPFLRVQNVTNEGLKLDNVVYINQKTHNSKLKRSQVTENDLVTKITGVGKMAVSAVAPIGFEGNINQHLVVIKTKNLEVSKTLANFLNSDIGEKLAFRRTTGGTRPALNYKALKSIPIVFEPEINKIMEEAYEIKFNKEKKSKYILDSINKFILKQLGFEMPKKLKDKICFIENSHELINNRFDPYYYQPKFKLIIDNLKNKKTKRLGNFITDIKYGASVKNTYVNEGIPFLRILNLKPNEINLENVVKIPFDMKKEIGNAFVHENDLLISRSGTVGNVAVVPEEADGFAYGSFMIKFSLNNKINEEFVSIWLNTSISNILIQREKIGAIQKNITISTIKNLIIPDVSLDIQEDLVADVKKRVIKAKRLQTEADEIVLKARNKVEKIILGD